MSTLSNSQSITALYIAAFGRAPDTSGLAYWTAQMDAGLTFDGVINSFLESQEAATLMGPGVSDQSFLGELYHNVLTRSADSGGAQYWQGRLDSLKSRADLIDEFIHSLSDSSGDDTKLLQNKIEIGQKFAGSISGNNTIYAKAMLTYVTSESSSLQAGQSLNDYFDHGAPAAVANDFYGKDFKLDFGYVGNFFNTTTVTAGDGVETSNFNAFSVDIGHDKIKISVDNGSSSFYVDGVTLVISDANHSLPAFTGSNVISNTWTVYPSNAFDPSQIVVSEDAVTITLSGLNLSAGTSLEFSLQS